MGISLLVSVWIAGLAATNERLPELAPVPASTPDNESISLTQNTRTPDWPDHLIQSDRQEGRNPTHDRIALNLEKAMNTSAKKFFSGSQLALAQAIAREDIAEVKSLLPRTELNRPGNEDMTLLFFTLQQASGEKPVPLQIITLLVKAGADPLQKIPGLGSALGVSQSARSPLYVQAFLNAGVSPNTVLDSTPILFNVAREATFDTLKLLVQRGADVNKHDSLGNTALTQALSSYQLDQVEWLLDRGANPDRVDINGNSFAAKLLFQINRQQPGTLTQRKLIEIRDRIVRMGVKWPPDSREDEQARMRARGQTPGKLLPVQSEGASDTK